MPSPSKVLAPVSAQRMNQQALPDPKSLPPDLLQFQLKSSKGVSEVQAKVALLNSLSRGNGQASTTSSTGTNAALQRAILGREEAESALVSVSAQLSEAQSRERRISERLESLLEELHSAKERQAHERVIFEKEIRKARKEAFRASSALVKMQEELKDSRAEIKALKDEVRSEREAKEKAEQEATERGDTLTSLTEEIGALKGKLQCVQASNELDISNAQSQETLENSTRAVTSTEEDDGIESPCHERMRMHERKIGRMSLAQKNAVMAAARGSSLKRASELDESPLSDSGSFSDIYSVTPLKRQRIWSEFISPKQDEDTIAIDSPNIKIQELRAKLQWEKQLRLEAEKTIEFMCLECQFKACRCRIAESEGRDYIYDAAYDKKLKGGKNGKEEEGVPSGEDHSSAASETRSSLHSRPPSGDPEEVEVAKLESDHEDEASEELLITFSPETGTFRTVPSPVRSPRKKLEKDSQPAPQPPEHQKQFEIDLLTLSPIKPGPEEQLQFDYAAKITVPSHEFCSPTPHPRATSDDQSGPLLSMDDDSEKNMHFMERSTTTTVPLKAEEDVPADPFTMPGTPISREAALAQIQARRGRARGMKRCASAADGAVRPGGMGVTPVRGARRIPGLHANRKTENDMGERRDISAPMRLFRK